MTTAHGIYAQQLLHLGHGLPMWGPEPCPDFGEIHLGDVGYLRDGFFCFLFNAMRSADDPVNVRRGVPLGFEVFRPPESMIIRRPNYITQPQLYSRSLQALSVSVGTSVESGVGGSASAGLRYRCREASGALLMLRAPAHKTILDCRLHIQKYIVAHLSSWCDFVNGSLGVGLEEKDIIFVSGFTKTSVWAETAFSNSSSDGELVIAGGCFVPSLSGEFRVSMMRSTDASIFARTGPYERVVDWTEETGPFLGDHQYDQSIFLNFYKMKSRRWWRPTVLRGAAGPHQLPETPDDEESSSIQRMPVLDSDESNEAFDPADYILDYILSHSDAQFACACDADWMILFTNGNYPEDFEVALEDLSPPVIVSDEGVGLISGPSSLVAHGRVVEVSISKDGSRLIRHTEESLSIAGHHGSTSRKASEAESDRDYSEAPALSLLRSSYTFQFPLKTKRQILGSDSKTRTLTPSSGNEIKLHWLLCPSIVLIGENIRQVCFDAAQSLDNISVHDYSRAPLFTLTTSEVQELLQRKVSQPPIRKMVLQYHACPQWYVHITRPDGDMLRVQDVLEALYKDLQNTVDGSDLGAPMYQDSLHRSSHEILSRHFKLNEPRAGIRRIDLMTGGTWFQGLSRPDAADHDYWVVDFGPARTTNFMPSP